MSARPLPLVALIAGLGACGSSATLPPDGGLDAAIDGVAQVDGGLDAGIDGAAPVDAAVAPDTANPEGRTCFASGWCWVGAPTGLNTGAVWAFAADDVWAAGNAHEVFHWDGKAWTPHPLPFAGYRIGLDPSPYMPPQDFSFSAGGIDSLWGRSSSDLWAAGGASLLLRWDGKTWSCATRPATNLPAPITYRGLWGTAAGDVFVIEFAAAVNTSRLHRWTGTSWERLGEVKDALVATWASGPDDVWFVGGRERGRAYRWNAGTLAEVPVPQPGPDAGYWEGALVSVSGSSPTDVWMAGEVGVFRWNGTAIEPIKGAWPPRSHPRAVWATPDRRWVAGLVTATASSSRTLIGDSGFISSFASDPTTATSLPVPGAILALSGPPGGPPIAGGAEGVLGPASGELRSMPLGQLLVTGGDRAFVLELVAPDDDLRSRLLALDGEAWRDTGLLNGDPDAYLAGFAEQAWVVQPDPSTLATKPVGHATLHFDGARWQPVDLPFAPRGVAVSGEGESWGTFYPGLGRGPSTAVHCTRAGCQFVPEVGFGESFSFWGAGDHLWAVVRPRFAAGQLRRLVGGAWTDVAVAPIEPDCLWGSGPDDVWIAGHGGIAHFDGTTITIEKRPGEVLCPIAGRGPRDVWLAGQVSTGQTTSCGQLPGASTFLLHFDGGGWRKDTEDVPLSIETLQAGPTSIWMTARGGGQSDAINQAGILRKTR